ncbi:hypothetical protein ACFY1B_40160 [Streptomyces mirabilis]|uniref:hypothetical protein n=1 Tax=Streptomyces mirabilis TaxID=68239 RepID=UPI0036BEB92D
MSRSRWNQVDDQVAVGELLGGIAQSVRGGLLAVPGGDGAQGHCRGGCPFPD